MLEGLRAPFANRDPVTAIAEHAAHQRTYERIVFHDQDAFAAAESALARLFPKFGIADNPAWDKVITKARDGAPDALTFVGYAGDVPANPVCKEVLDRISGAGTSGTELQRQLSEPEYGWPADAINGALTKIKETGWAFQENVSFPAGQVSDFAPILQRLRLGGVDLIFHALFAPDGIQVARAMKALNYDLIAAVHVAGVGHDRLPPGPSRAQLRHEATAQVRRHSPPLAPTARTIHPSNTCANVGGAT